MYPLILIIEISFTIIEFHREDSLIFQLLIPKVYLSNFV